MEQTGTFECSNEAVNQLVQNSIWSQRSNFCDVPTDCPIRELAAWTGDMGVFAETGIFLEDCYPVIRKWLAECRLAQYPDGKVANIAPANNRPSYFSSLLAGSVGWGDACILVPYALYQRFGDKRILEENYEMMQDWHHFLESRAAQGRETSIPDISALPEEYQNMVNNLPKEQLEKIMKKMMTEKGQNSNGTPGQGLLKQSKILISHTSSIPAWITENGVSRMWNPQMQWKNPRVKWPPPTSHIPESCCLKSQRSSANQKMRNDTKPWQNMPDRPFAKSPQITAESIQTGRPNMSAPFPLTCWRRKRKSRQRPT